MYDERITYEAVLDTSGSFEPGAGWYVVAANDGSEYVAYCGPADYDQSEKDARRIAEALTVTQ